jgi:hypothetical protein
LGTSACDDGSGIGVPVREDAAPFPESPVAVNGPPLPELRRVSVRPEAPKTVKRPQAAAAGVRLQSLAIRRLLLGRNATVTLRREKEP